MRTKNFRKAFTAVLVGAVLTAGGVYGYGQHATSGGGGATANWYVAPTGSDSNSGTDSAHPFLTLSKAYRSASCGQTVQLTGTFTAQETIFETRKSCADGTYVTYQGPATFKGTDCGAEPCSALTIETADIKLTTVTFQQSFNTNCCGAQLSVVSSCGTTYGTQNVLIDQITGTRFTVTSVKNVTVQDSTWDYLDDYGTGGSHVADKGGCAGAVDYPGDNIGVRITRNSWVESMPTASCDAHLGAVCHLDCLTIWSASPNGANPGDSVWIDRNTFKQCNAIDVWWKHVPASGASTTLGGMLIENNDLQASVTGASATELNCEDLSSELVENSAYRYNSLQSGSTFLIGTANCTFSNVKVIGNVMPNNSGCGTSGITFGHNIVSSSACSGDTTVGSISAQYTNNSTMDLTLVGGSSAISAGDTGYFPTLDKDGNTRPIGTVDAGAHERS